MRIYTPAVLLVALFFVPALTAAATIQVPGDEPTIQAGIDVANAGDTVLVAPGTYTGEGNRDIDFGGTDLVVKSAGGAEVTIIECGGSEGDPHRGFFFHSGETPGSVVEGLTITGGYGPDDTLDADVTSAGGAIACREGTAPAIRDCVFISNSAGGWGGALYSAYHASPMVSGCSFLENHAFSGGAAFCYRYGSFSASDCIFEGNSANRDGGCIDYVTGSILSDRARGVSLTECTFTANSAGDHGGAVNVPQGGINISHSVFSENTADYGGGLCASRNTVGLIIDCVFLDNSAEKGGGVLLYDWAYPEFRRCTFEGNTAQDGGGMFCGWRAWPMVLNSSFDSNSAARGGGVFCHITHVPPVVPSFFMVRWVDNTASVEGGSLYCEEDAWVIINQSTLFGGGSVLRTSSGATLENTIIAFAAEVAVSCDGSSSAELICCDLFGNAGGDWVGCISDQYGMNGNICEDPLFCDPGSGNLHIQEISPCAPAQQPDCGLIGALGVGCGATATVPTTWGLIKSIFGVPGE